MSITEKEMLKNLHIGRKHIIAMPLEEIRKNPDQILKRFEIDKILGLKFGSALTKPGLQKIFEKHPNKVWIAYSVLTGKLGLAKELGKVPPVKPSEPEPDIADIPEPEELEKFEIKEEELPEPVGFKKKTPILIKKRKKMIIEEEEELPETESDNDELDRIYGEYMEEFNRLQILKGQPEMPLEDYEKELGKFQELSKSEKEKSLNEILKVIREPTQATLTETPVPRRGQVTHVTKQAPGRPVARTETERDVMMREQQTQITEPTPMRIWKSDQRQPDTASTLMYLFQQLTGNQPDPTDISTIPETDMDTNISVLIKFMEYHGNVPRQKGITKNITLMELDALKPYIGVTYSTRYDKVPPIIPKRNVTIEPEIVKLIQQITSSSSDPIMIKGITAKTPKGSYKRI